MRVYIPILSVLVFLSSCSVYRDGQTPDDVYYSPARTQQGGGAAYAEAGNGREDGRRYRDRNGYSGYDDYATPDDRWLMMRVRNPYRWSMFDDYNYYSPYGSWGWGGFSPGFGLGFSSGFYDPYGFSYYNHFNNYWNWNSFYNPYYPNIIVVNPKTNPAGYNRLRTFNLTRYNNNAYSNRTGINRPTGDFRSRYNNTNSNSRLGSSGRGAYQNSSIDSRPRSSYNNRSYNERPSRTYSPSTNNGGSYRPSGGSSGSSGSGSSGGGGGSRPTRSR